MIFSNPLRIVFAALGMCVAANAATIFNFDGDSLGTSTSFTDTVNGLSATFSNSVDPGGFVVYQSMFETLTGNVLGDPGPQGSDGLVLDVSFSQNLSAVTLNFATAEFNTTSPLTLTAYENAAQVGTATSKGMFLNGFSFPEGEIAFAGGPFNKIAISSPALDFAVDNIAVATAPEPSAFILLGAGLISISMIRRRSNSSRR